MSRIESGRQGIRTTDLRALLEIYGVAPTQADELLTLARQSRQRGWWHTYGDVLPEWFQAFVGLEGEATRRRSYDVELIPGLLQTPDYYRAHVVTDPSDLTSEEIDRKIEFRRARQERAIGNETLELCFILHEASLRIRIGDAPTMRAQLLHLVEASHRPNTTLQVLPFSAGMHPAMGGGFVVLTFAQSDPDVVYLENQVGSLYLEQKAAVDRYNLVHDCLREKALNSRESRSLLAKLAKEV